MLVQQSRRWPYINPALVECTFLLAIPYLSIANTHQIQWCFNTVPVPTSQTVRRSAMSRCIIFLGPGGYQLELAIKHEVLAMLGQRRRRWTSISPAMGNASCLHGRWDHGDSSSPWWDLASGIKHDKPCWPMLVQCWSAVYDVGPTLNQHYQPVHR